MEMIQFEVKELPANFLRWTLAEIWGGRPTVGEIVVIGGGVVGTAVSNTWSL